MDAKSSVWVRKSAWHLFDQQIKLRAGYGVLNPRRIKLLPQKLQNLSVFGVIGHFVLLGNQSYSCKSPKAKGKGIVSGFRGLNQLRLFFSAVLPYFRGSEVG